MSSVRPIAPQGIKAAQLADQIRDLCAVYFQQKVQHDIVTVTAVTLSADIRHATAWVRVFPIERSDQVISILQRGLKHFQSLLQHDVQRKFVPYLQIKADTSEEDTNHISSLLNS